MSHCVCKIYSVEDDARIVPGDGLYQTFHMYPHDSICEQIPRTNSKTTHIKNNHQTTTGPRRRRTSRRGPVIYLWQHRTIPALRLKHRSDGCRTATALPKCSIMSGCGTRIVLRGQKPLALCNRCPCFGSLFPPLAALTFAASSIICAFGLASAAPRSPYRHLELCGIAHKQQTKTGSFPLYFSGKAAGFIYSTVQSKFSGKVFPSGMHWPSSVLGVIMRFRYFTSCSQSSSRTGTATLPMRLWTIWRYIASAVC